MVLRRRARPPLSRSRACPRPHAARAALTAEQAGRGFIAAYVDPDGRVVRRDQDGDTVSEGQAYAMLVAVAIGDRATFDAVWSWTRQHLLRPDQTLSWHWRNGSVVDASSASDADLDAARALVIAGGVFGDAELTAAGVRLGQAILDVETVNTPLGRILVAGSWAQQDPYVYNPSYPSPVAFDLLHKASGDQRWIELAAGSRAPPGRSSIATPCHRTGARWTAEDRFSPPAGAAGHGIDGLQYGYDAARMPLRYAESCSGEDVALAARLSAPLSRAPQHAAVRSLDGAAVGTDESVVAMAGLAAATRGSGDPGGAQPRSWRPTKSSDSNPATTAGPGTRLDGCCSPTAPWAAARR